MFDEPGGVGFARGTVYIADTNNHLVRALEIASGKVSTVTLSNLAVASALTPGRAVKLTVEGQVVAPGAANLQVTFNAPAGYRLNSQAPSRLALATSNPAVLDLGETALSWSSDEASVTLPVPTVLNAGTATLTGTASVYYCRTGEEALCFITQVEVTLPVTVDAAATQGELRLTYALPVFSS